MRGVGTRPAHGHDGGRNTAAASATKELVRVWGIMARMWMDKILLLLRLLLRLLLQLLLLLLLQGSGMLRVHVVAVHHACSIVRLLRLLLLLLGLLRL